MVAQRPTRVLLADDQTMHLDGLTHILGTRGGIEVVGQAPNDERAVALAREKEPDVVVVQTRAPTEKVKRVLAGVLGLPSPPKVVVMTLAENPRYVRELMGLGASAHLLKGASADHLVNAIRATVSDPDGEDAVVGAPAGALERWREGPLTAREMEVLLLSARGLSSRRVARLLYLSESTVRRHLSNVYAKIGVHSRTEAARKALAEGWISLREVTGEEERG